MCIRCVQAPLTSHLSEPIRTQPDAIVSVPVPLLPLLFRNANDPKQMLEIGKEPEKLKAMRVIVSEMARSVDQSEYFPSVVKCVVSKSIEVRLQMIFMSNPSQSLMLQFSHHLFFLSTSTSTSLSLPVS